MMPARNHDGVFVFVEPKMLLGLARIVVLEIVAGMIILVFDHQQGSIFWRHLLFHRAVPFDAIQVVVRADASVVLVIKIE